MSVDWYDWDMKMRVCVCVQVCTYANTRFIAYLSNRREPDKSNRGYTCARDIEAQAASAAAASLWGDEFTTELGELPLELTKVVAGRLIFLGLGHLIFDVL